MMPPDVPLRSPSGAASGAAQDRAAPTVFQSFWHPGPLPPLAWACYQSFVAGGQDVHLYAYSAFDVPAGTSVRDAREILPEAELFVHLNSLSPFSDLFRYSMLYQKGGWWIDADVLFTGREFPGDDVVYAEQEPGTVNAGQMKFPAGHAVLAEALGRYRELDISRVKWVGYTGPGILTAVLKSRGEDKSGFPASVLFPIHWLEAYKLLLPEHADDVSDRIAGSPFVHLWGSMIDQFSGRKETRPLAGSFLDRLFQRFGIYEKFQLEPTEDRAVRECINRMLRQEWIEAYRKDPLSLDLPYA